MGDYIYEAIRSENEYHIELYIRHGGNINAMNDRGFTPLGYAIRYRYARPGNGGRVTVISKRTIEYLLRAGANPNIMEGDGFTPFLARLIDYGGADYISILGLMLDGKDGKQRADLAVPASDATIYPGYTGLHIAAQLDRGDVIDLLIRNGANVNALVVSDTARRGYTPLLLAAEVGHERQVRRLLDKRADPSINTPNNTTALSLAAKSGNFESVKALINKLNNVNVPNNDGNTALIYACRTDKLNVVRLLLEKGAEVNHQANNGITPLMSASFYNHLPIIQELLLAGANVNLRAITGVNALTVSINPGASLPITKTLLDAGADVDVEDNEGRTPLFFAVYNRKNEIVLELLRRGADSSRMFRGQTIAAYARTRGLPAEILEALTLSRRHHALRGFAALTAPAPAPAAAASRRGGWRKRRLTRRRQ
jgi:ankyrin repeat protein